ncbi:hypothetical protein [Aliamphritea ceti]|uniref:hypothetical protein n=1 Tax=Aliamphritea ceti TaxID=1524258 RepID=UPI0021C28811|nr:hypothetical protein [Aliamphritea ceti]
MNMNFTGTVIQAKRYSMDGNQGASIFLTQPTDGDNPDVCGLEIMKMSADYSVVELLKNVLPCECDIVAKPVAGAQQKMAFKLVSIKPKTDSPTAKQPRPAQS